MNQDRALQKIFTSDPGASHTPELPVLPEWAEASQAELYGELPPLHKHSASFINRRRKVRFLAEERLLHLSTQLLNLANEIRYHDPLLAEVLDEAWDVTEEALDLMQKG
jgi:hypothetical protein